jgi:hypothetical protein
VPGTTTSSPDAEAGIVTFVGLGVALVVLGAGGRDALRVGTGSRVGLAAAPVVVAAGVPAGAATCEPNAGRTTRTSAATTAAATTHVHREGERDDAAE